MKIKIFLMTVLAAVLLACAGGFVQSALAGEKLGIIIYSDDAETAWNALRLANFSMKKGGEVSVFFLGKGVVGAQKTNETFNVKEQAEDLVKAGGKVYACKVCLKLHKLEPSETCPVSTMEDLYSLIMSNNKVLTF
ncbi:DsrE family protein [Dissulfurimicrobium hydrothermale]|uniref:DsrE family protein n=1 Tax=Dissulfurimicrobium hydrothermale TaxID=1750598 RepID=UPI001EDBEDF7|nr:DsrE family protein [Dissulfurimicrobium hydrothermale]UKL13428.1 DsrE family protein [Dissulfurimicrobium hydrothermale]